MPRASRSLTLGLGHACCTGALCDCRRRTAQEEIDRVLAAGARVLVLRGAPWPLPPALIARAREAGVERIVACFAADTIASDGDARAVARSGADAVRLPLFSHVPRVHDRLRGREGALAAALVAVRALARAEVAIEIDAPLLPLRLSRPTEIVALLSRALEALPRVRFYTPPALPPALGAPPRWDELGADLGEALRRLRDAGADASIEGSQAIPLCALDEDLQGLHRFGRARRAEAPASECRTCVMRGHCPLPAGAYVRAHGGAGLRPFASRPSALSGRASARPRWTRKEHEAARGVGSLVLRPTVNCNQDCVFCSANETSANVWTDPGAMLRQIARAAQRGVRRVSFSGGEPTLSPHLRSFVEAAHRLGVPEIELVTNGVLLDREPKVRALASAGLTHAFVSLHAHDEQLSRALTQKEGDHARTLAAIDHFVAAGVVTAINHVITSRNYPFLAAFVERLHARFGGKVLLSFAFVTPQYKALEHLELMPRLSEVMPVLEHAMRRALELGQPFVVGSRQGIPPCFLGPFAAWSDVWHLAAEAASEDAPQKTQGEACGRCRYRRLCPGLWRPYAGRHGTGELRAVAGEPFSDEELAAIHAHHRPPPWGMPMSFEQAQPSLRDPSSEARPLAPPPTPRIALPVVRLSRPLRVLLIGSGSRARVLARELERAGMVLAGRVSPHAPEATGWGHEPALRDAEQALDELRPEAAIIAAATGAHAALARLCAARKIPFLLEKPIAARADHAAALAAELAGAFGSCAYQGLFAAGLPDSSGATKVVLTRRIRPDAPDAPRAWSRASMTELLHHLLAPLARDRGELSAARARSIAGDARPERMRFDLAFERGPAELVVDLGASADGLTIDVGTDAAPERWERGSGRGPGEVEAMLAAFRDAVRAQGPAPVPLAVGARIGRAALGAIRALEEAGAPFDRAGAPKHVASRTHREDGTRR